jgi:ABC-2 type transport system permease protein
MKLLYLIKKEFIEILNQREQIAMMFVAPLLQVVLLGYVVTTDIRHVPVGIVKLSDNPVTERLISRIRATPLFDVRSVDFRPYDYVEELKKGRIKAIIIFRDSPDVHKVPVKYPEAQILMDGVDSNTSLIAAGYFNGIIKEYLLGDLGRLGRSVLPVDKKVLILFNPELRSINYMGPGIVALLLTIITMFLTAISLVREKEQQTLDTLMISRLRVLEIFLGKAIPMAVVGLIEMALGLLVVRLFFQVPIRGHVIYLFLTAAIYLAALLSYAILIATFTSTQQQALFFAWFSMLTFLLLSGLFTPVENIPPGLRFFADINPLRYLIQIIREIFLKGNGPEHFWRELLKLGAIAVVVTSVSLAIFRRFVSK